MRLPCHTTATIWSIKKLVVPLSLVMQNRLYILLLTILCSVALCAETCIVLRSADAVIGTIVFQNEEVIVIKDIKGNRYQYPMSEVERIEEVAEEVPAPEPEAKPSKVGAMLQIKGGGLVDSALPTAWGGNASGKLIIGAKDVLGKRIFLGGGLGYEALIIADKTFSMLPLELYAAVPFLQTKHAPYCGLGVGYNVTLQKKQIGGLFAEIDFGWRVQVNTKTALMLGVNAHFQQLTNDWQEQVADTWATNNVTHTLCGISAKLALLF